jgi:FlaA1/EpsC-like NDP-sugar epimerase
MSGKKPVCRGDGKGVTSGVGRPLLLLGASEQTKMALAAVRAMSEWVPVGVLDDDPATHGRDLDGVPVLGGTELVHQLPDAALFACDPSVIDRLGLPRERWVTMR